jgi:hypothetical protein
MFICNKKKTTRSHKHKWIANYLKCSHFILFEWPFVVEKLRNYENIDPAPQTKWSLAWRFCIAVLKCLLRASFLLFRNNVCSVLKQTRYAVGLITSSGSYFSEIGKLTEIGTLFILILCATQFAWNSSWELILISNPKKEDLSKCQANCVTQTTLYSLVQRQFTFVCAIPRRSNVFREQY